MLEFVHKLVLLFELPVERNLIFIMIPPSVKPDSPYRTVFSKKLRELVVHKLPVSRPVGTQAVAARCVPCASPRIIVACPVEMGIIEVKLQVIVPACVGKLA